MNLFIKLISISAAFLAFAYGQLVDDFQWGTEELFVDQSNSVQQLQAMIMTEAAMIRMAGVTFDDDAQDYGQARMQITGGRFTARYEAGPQLLQSDAPGGVLVNNPYAMVYFLIQQLTDPDIKTYEAMPLSGVGNVVLDVHAANNTFMLVKLFVQVENGDQGIHYDYYQSLPDVAVPTRVVLPVADFQGYHAGQPAMADVLRDPNYILTQLYLSMHPLSPDAVGSISLEEIRFSNQILSWGGEFFDESANGRYTSPHLGAVQFPADPANSTSVWCHSLQSWFQLGADSAVRSAEYGVASLVGDSGWMFSGVFGWTHFGADENQYGGWVNTERFDWMKFETSGEQTYLWVPMMNSWMSVNEDGSFYSFQWRQLTPLGLNRYESSVFGGLTTGDFNGWVSSDRFGWMWANGDGEWYWSETRKEWLGVTAEGGIWSTEEGQFL